MANNAGVLVVVAVVLTSISILTAGQVGFMTRAVHVVQHYRPGTAPKPAAGRGSDGAGKTQLPAGHLCLLYAPSVITHRSPISFHKDLKSTLVVSCTPDQTSETWERTIKRTQPTCDSNLKKKPSLQLICFTDKVRVLGKACPIHPLEIFALAIKKEII